MNDFDVPADREVPADVLTRMDQTITLGIDAPENRRRGRTPWYAAAAVVAVLGAGAVVLSNQGEDTQTAADQAQMAPTLDKCWAVVQSQGRAGQFPDRASWRGVFQVAGQVPKFLRMSDSPTMVTAIRAAKKVFFCEESGHGVLITDPDAKPVRIGNSQTGVLLGTESGTVAGVVDPSWKHVAVDINPGNLPKPNDTDIPTSGEATVRDGLFVFNPGTMYIRRDKDFPVRVTSGLDAGAAPVHVPWPPMGWTTQPPDSFSDCVQRARNSQPVDAPGSWTRAAATTPPGNKPIVYTYVNQKGDFGACYSNPDGAARFETYPAPPAAGPFQPTVVHVAPGTSGDGPTIMGRVDDSAMRVVVVLPGGQTAEGYASRTNFVVALPPSTRLDNLTCRVYARDGHTAHEKVVYEGPLLTK